MLSEQSKFVSARILRKRTWLRLSPAGSNLSIRIAYISIDSIYDQFTSTLCSSLYRFEVVVDLHFEDASSMATQTFLVN